MSKRDKIRLKLVNEEELMTSNTVVKNVCMTSDWLGRPYILLNCEGDLHVYVPEGHVLAAALGGHTLRLVVK